MSPSVAGGMMGTEKFVPVRLSLISSVSPFAAAAPAVFDSVLLMSPWPISVEVRKHREAKRSAPRESIGP